MGSLDKEPVRKKVLFLLEAFDKGGIEKVTLDIVNHLSPSLYDITVQTFWWGGYCQSQVNSNVKIVPFFSRRYIRGIIRLIEWLPPRLLYRFFVHGKYDIEIAASDGGAAKVISGSTNGDSKKICWVHMDVVERGSKLREFKSAASARKIYSNFHEIVCVSNACKDKFLQKFGQYPILVKYNPLPSSEIREKASENPLVTPHSGVNFVCVGRLVEQKGFDRLLEACGQLVHDNITCFHIWIVGEGPERKHLESLIERLDLQSNVELLGFKGNPFPYMKAADVFLLSSRDESFSLVVGESLIVGTPVIATNCCGIEEWLGKDERYGYIVENSTKGIYDGIKRICLNPNLLTQFKMHIPELSYRLDFDKSLSSFEEILS